MRDIGAATRRLKTWRGFWKEPLLALTSISGKMELSGKVSAVSEHMDDISQNFKNSRSTRCLLLYLTSSQTLLHSNIPIAMSTSLEASLPKKSVLFKASVSRTTQMTLLVVVLSFFCFAIWKMVPRARQQSLNFSNIQRLSSFDVAKTAPRQYRPWKAGKYNMTMGIRKMPEEDWLLIDNKYEEEQNVKRFLLETNRGGVMQVLPCAEEACEEALDCIVDFLINRYPSQFQRPREKPGYVYNGITNRTFKVTKPYKQHPLEVAAQLVMEDINLLIQGSGQNAQDYYL
jgi:Haem-dependent oxidative N-demethylase, alpha subunit-like